MASAGYLSFKSSDVAPEHLGHVLNEYLAYERAETVRKRLIWPLCILGLVLAIADGITRIARPTTMIEAMAVLVSIGVGAWINEQRAVARLRRRLFAAGIGKS